MLLIIREKADDETIKKAAEDLNGYIKFVVDVKLEVLAAGGTRHFEDEKLLLEDGSQQEDLWGGGLDLATGEVDFDSMINIRPHQDNPSREILSQELRKKISEIVRRLLK